MIRYMAIYGSRKFEVQVEYELGGPVLCVDDEIPETPYVKLEIKIVGKEERYAAKRKSTQEKPAQKKPKKRRFLIFGREK